MGCGQSKIHLYPRKNKSKSSCKKSSNESDQQQLQYREKDKTEEEFQPSQESSPEHEIILPILKQNGPLLQSQEISTSQQNFFQMLDKKIEQGKDYDSNSETEIALEEARLNSLIHHWESASLSISLYSSASRSLQNTPEHYTPPVAKPQHRSQMPQSLNAQFLTEKQVIEQLQEYQVNPTFSGCFSTNSPKKIELNQNNRKKLLAQTIFHQSYGVQPQQSHMLSLYQHQQNMQLKQLSPSYVTPNSSNYTSIQSNINDLQNSSNRNLACFQVPNFASQEANVLTEGELQSPSRGSCFPHAISVNRLAPQVQRQLRETQELIKTDCSSLYQSVPAFQSNTNSLRFQNRPGVRRSTLETQFSTELS